MFKTFVGNFWNIVFSILIHTWLWLVMLLLCPKVLAGIVITFIISLFFVKWWK